MDLWGFSLQVWERVFFLSTGIAAVAGAISVTAACVAGIVGYQMTDHWQRDADSRIAIGKTETARANEKAAEANARAEEAKAVAAEATRSAESEKLERLKLDAKIAPRRLNEEQSKSMASSLSPFAGKKVKVSSHLADVESAILGLQIMKALELAKIEPFDRRLTYQAIGAVGFGIMVSGENQPLVSAFLRALPKELGALPGAPPAGPGVVLIQTAAENSVLTEATIFVGVKPIAP